MHMRSFIISSFMQFGFHADNPTLTLYANNTTHLLKTASFLRNVNKQYSPSYRNIFYAFVPLEFFATNGKMGCLTSMLISTVERVFSGVKLHKILNISIMFARIFITI